MKGVFPATKKDGTIYYRSSITYRRKHISLGSYSSCEEAHFAYLEAEQILNDSQITIEDYHRIKILSFEKFVILINFRDNHIYFGTPIYARKNYFQYFLSPDFILKFDTDDLFYYSSHKIMKRDGHLFVADYGMQVNILNRYGIKNYAVVNKDYRFVNQDTTDFRRSNLQIINVFHGVTIHTKKGKTYYKAKINLPGSYTIGTYQTEYEAAIAYNKAIDLLKKAGVTRNFTPNYMEGISPAYYADIYSEVSISSKIINYTKKGL